MVAEIKCADGNDAYQAIYSVMNEQGQIIAAYLTRTDSLKEVEIGLIQLAQRLVHLQRLLSHQVILLCYYLFST